MEPVIGRTFRSDLISCSRSSLLKGLGREVKVGVLGWGGEQIVWNVQGGRHAKYTSCTIRLIREKWGFLLAQARASLKKRPFLFLCRFSLYF
jgi:hypothetical protein